jgi:hypothetical protein
MSERNTPSVSVAGYAHSKPRTPPGPRHRKKGGIVGRASKDCNNETADTFHGQSGYLNGGSFRSLPVIKIR